MNLQQNKHLILKVLFGTLKFLRHIINKIRFKHSNSLLILQLHFIGDLVMVTPAISLLKKKMPYCKLHIMVSNRAVPVVAQNPHIDKVYTDHTDHTTTNSPSFFLRKLFANIGNMASMWKENYDYIIDYSGYLDSAFIANVVCGKNIVGVATLPAYQYAYDYFYYIDFTERKRLGLNYLHLLSYFKIAYAKEDYNYRIFLTESDHASAKKLLQNARGIKIAIAPFAGWTSKEWPLDRFIALCNKLAKLPTTVLLLGDSGNATMLENYKEQLSADVVCYAGKTSLMESAALIAESDLFVGVDSAMSYFAAAFDIPSVLIFGSTNPAFHWEKNPGKLIIIYKAQTCSCNPTQLYCGDNTIKYKCPYDKRCMRAISVEEVYSSALELLAEKDS